MAERRMFAKTIIDSDAFLEMPLSTQCLYFHLNMRADDDGFVNNPKRIQRMIGASDDDLKLLVMKSFVLMFESGIIVIKHWKINNYLQNDRHKKTVYQEEMKMLTTKENKAYTFTDTGCIQNVYSLDTQDSIGKNSIDKNRDMKKPKGFTAPTLPEVKAYCEEKGLSVDPKAFLDYFTESNWIDSKGNKVRNWKQKLLTWQKYEPKQREEKVFQSTGSTIEKKEVDPEIERMLREYGTIDD